MHFYMPSKCIHSPVLNNGPSEYMEYTIPIMCSRSNQFPMGWPHPKKGNKNAANPPPPRPGKITRHFYAPSQCIWQHVLK